MSFALSIPKPHFGSQKFCNQWLDHFNKLSTKNVLIKQKSYQHQPKTSYPICQYRWLPPGTPLLHVTTGDPKEKCKMTDKTEGYHTNLISKDKVG